jgi:hypothetical protein
VINFKTLAIAAAVSSGVFFSMPVASQAMPPAVPVKIDGASNGNFIQVYYRRYCPYGYYRRYGRCYRYARYHRYYRPYYGYYRPYYGYYRQPYYGYYPYYGYRRPFFGFPFFGFGMGW